MSIASTLRSPFMLFLCAATLAATACASVEDTAIDEDTGSGGSTSTGGTGSGTGGTTTGTGGTAAGTGGTATGTGGVFGTTGGTGSGGVFGTTGGTGSGGAATGGAGTGGASTGGASTGGASTGGTSTGGASTGGSGTGGTVIMDGPCAGLPTWAEWKTTSGATGDQVVYACTVAQSGCSGKMVGVNYLWSCNQSHVPNCQTQGPQDGNSWTYVGQCTD